MPVDIDIAVDPSDGVRALKQVADQQNRIANADKTSLVASERLLKVRAAIAATVTTVAAALVGRATMAILEHVRASDALSKSLGISAEKAQELALAEKDAGLSEGSVESAIIAIAEAQGKHADELLRLGFSFSEIQELNPVEIFENLAERLNEGTGSARELSDILSVTGNNKELIRALTGGFSDLQKEVTESGRVIQEEVFDRMVDSTRKLSEAIKELQAVFQPFLQFAVGVATGLTETVSGLLNDLQDIPNFFKAFNSGLKEANSLSEVKAAFDSAIKASNEAKDSRNERIAQRIAAQDKKSSNTNIAEQLGEADRLAQLSVQLGAKPQVDSLARVGLFAGRGQNEAVALQRKAAKLLVSIDRTAKQQNQTLEEKL